MANLSTDPEIKRRADLGREMVARYGDQFSDALADAIDKEHGPEAALCWLVALDYL